MLRAREHEGLRRRQRRAWSRRSPTATAGSSGSAPSAAWDAASGSTPCASSATPATWSRSARSTRSTRSTSPIRRARSCAGSSRSPATRPTCTRSATTCCWASARTRPGRREVTGLQLSLFDVSDLARPARLAAGRPRVALLGLGGRMGPPRVPVLARDGAGGAADRQRGLQRRGRVHRLARRRDRGARADRARARRPRRLRPAGPARGRGRRPAVHDLRARREGERARRAGRRRLGRVPRGRAGRRTGRSRSRPRPACAASRRCRARCRAAASCPGAS